MSKIEYDPEYMAEKGMSPIEPSPIPKSIPPTKIIQPLQPKPRAIVSTTKGKTSYEYVKEWRARNVDKVRANHREYMKAYRARKAGK